MIRPAVALGSLAAVALVAGCSILDPARGEPIPSGAQEIHVTIAGDAVTLQPDRVRAGDVYLVVDEPPDGSIVFVGGGETNGQISPLGPGAVERLERGDTEATAMSGFQAGGCSPEQAEAARGRTGPCGNVMQVVVGPGLYAVMAESPERAGLPVAVLTVTP